MRNAGIDDGGHSCLLIVILCLVLMSVCRRPARVSRVLTGGLGPHTVLSPSPDNMAVDETLASTCKALHKNFALAGNDRRDPVSTSANLT